MRGRTLAIGLAAGLALTACGGVEDADPGAAVAEGDEGAETDLADPDGEPSQGGSITIGTEAEGAGWSPWGNTLGASSVARSFYDTLLDYDEDGVPQPNLAASIEPNEEYTEYTLTLREDVVFHDGAPLDADAVVANLDQHRGEGATTGGEVAPVEDVVADDELTVRFVLDQPHVAFASVLAGPVGMMVSPEAFEDAESQPVGAGPFQMESWQRDQELVVTRHEDYWRDDLPYLDQITFRPIPDEDARLQSLFAGDVDAMQTLRQSTISQARERADDFNLYEHLANNSGGAILNTAVPPFDDVRVRQAWAHAIDQDDLIAVLGGEGISPPARGVFNPDSPWYVDEIEDAWPSQDLDRAQELIDDYVDDPERSDGEEPGTPVSFTFDTQPDPSLVETSSVYQAQVAEIGMEMQIQNVDQAVHIQEATGEAPDFIGDFQAKIWRLGSEDDPDWMVNWFAPGSPINFTNFSSEELMGALIGARQTDDIDERRELYHQAQLIFAEEVPFTLTGHTATLYATTLELFGFDDWELPDGQAGVGHPQSIARYHSLWLDQ